MSYRKIMLLCIIPAVAALLTLALNIALAQGGGNPADIVISEVMFNAITETSPTNCGEWLEIYNRAHVTINLTGWAIRDFDGNTRTITTSMCPNNSCEIPPGGCWLIAPYTREANYLQAEFNFYTSPLRPTVLHTSTIFLGARIGGGLANDEDGVALLIVSAGVTLAVDCVSWGTTTPTFCSSLNYVDGGNGADTNRGDKGSPGAHDGQSIANIQGQWYDHERNASPYNCVNTAAGGSPTGIEILSLSVLSYNKLAAVALAGLIAVLGAGFWLKARG